MAISETAHKTVTVTCASRIIAFTRLHLLAKVVSRVGRWGKDRAKLNSGNRPRARHQSSEGWQIHYENWLRDGWSQFTFMTKKA